MAGEVVGITTSRLNGGENLNFAIPIDDVKSLLATSTSTLRKLPNEPISDKPLSRGYLFNTLICLDHVMNTVETPFYHPGGDGCLYFVVRFPLSPEDAELLDGRSPDDDELMLKMQVQSMNATTMSVAKLSGQGNDVPATMIGAIWSSFEQNRDAFCSRHSKMYVFDLKLDGTSTPPTLCSTSMQKK